MAYLPSSRILSMTGETPITKILSFNVILMSVKTNFLLNDRRPSVANIANNTWLPSKTLKGQKHSMHIKNVC